MKRLRSGRPQSTLERIADARDRHEPLHQGIGAPARAQVVVEPPDLLVEQGQQGTVVVAESGRRAGARARRAGSCDRR